MRVRLRCEVPVSAGEKLARVQDALRAGFIHTTFEGDVEAAWLALPRTGEEVVFTAETRGGDDEDDEVQLKTVVERIIWIALQIRRPRSSNSESLRGTARRSSSMVGRS